MSLIEFLPVSLAVAGMGLRFYLSPSVELRRKRSVAPAKSAVYSSPMAPRGQRKLFLAAPSQA